MNRYLLRSLVAVLTFSIGVAVGSFGSRSEKRFSRYRDCPAEREVRLRRSHFTHRNYSSRPGPFLSIDALSTDPLKLTYSSTTPISNDLARQKVELQVANNTKRGIASFTVEYRSRWRSRRQGGGGVVSVATKTGSGNPNELDIVSIECNGDENLTIWIASVEFKDGSRWNNTRHSNEASNQGSSSH